MLSHKRSGKLKHIAEPFKDVLNFVSEKAFYVDEGNAG
jgi:hypothetical protein